MAQYHNRDQEPSTGLLFRDDQKMVLNADLVFVEDGLYSIGGSGENRVKDINASGTITAGTFSGAFSGTSSTLTTALNVTTTAIGATPSATKGVFITNTTDAADGAQQASPSLLISSETWNTSASVEQKWRLHHLGTQAAAPVSNLVLSCNPGVDATYDTFLTLSWDNTAGSITVGQAASLLWATDGGGNVGATGATRPGTVFVKNALDVQAAHALGATPSTTKGLLLVSTTDAADGAQQASPSLIIGSETWNTSATTVQNWRLHHLGTQAAAPVSNLVLGCDPGNATYDPFLTCSWNDTAGQLTLNQDVDLLWTTDATSEIGGASSGRPLNVNLTGQVKALAAMAIGEAETTTRGLWIENSTESVVTGGTGCQWSPPIILGGTAWDTVPGASVRSAFLIRNETVEGNPPTSKLKILHDAGEGSGYQSLLQFSTNGASGNYMTFIKGYSIIWNTDGGGSIGFDSGNRPDYVYAKTGLVVFGGGGSGVAGSTTITNVTAAKDSVAATLGNTPTGVAAANAAWAKIWIGTTAAWVPYWTA